MSEFITFFSTCCTCGHPQLQDGYTRAALSRLLEYGRIIEADCLKCDVLWPISPQERAALAGAIAAEHEDSLLSAGDYASIWATEGRREYGAALSGR